MKILQVLEAATGGAARHVLDLSAELVARGHEVSLVYSPTRTDARFEAAVAALGFEQVERLPMRRAVGPWDIGAAHALRRIIERLGPFDVVHAHSSKAGALARLATPSGMARVYTPHAFRTMDPGTGALGRLVYGGAEGLLGRFFSEAVIAVSPEEAEHARMLGVPPGKIHTVINGVGPAPVVDRGAARRSLGLAPDHIAVGFVGRLCDQKDPVRFARAIRIAHARDPRIRGVVLGDGELKAETEAAGGEALTIFSGLNAREYMPAFDIFAMTSRYEAMPYVLLEALQAGLPIVATKVGGTSVTVRDGENGLLLPVEAGAEDIVESFHRLLRDSLRHEAAKRSHLFGQSLVASEMSRMTEDVYALAGGMGADR